MHRRLLLAALSAAVLGACSEATNSTGLISKRIGEVISDSSATEVDLGKLTTFGWDRLYIFKPGATREEMCKFLNANRNACGRVIRVERTPDGQVAMVFSQQGQVTHFEFHAFENGRFDMNMPDGGHPRAASVFRIRRNTGTSTVWLEPK